ncbi:SAM-dependent methyltransferase [Amycolatopsis mediterranei]|uniref:SAM-dependent methyltransferase n=1 Tax=Amycolatopsis mediterranei TaxID=33910 RepID=UPI00344ACB28
MPSNTQLPPDTPESFAPESLSASDNPPEQHRSISDTALTIAAENWKPAVDLCCPHPARIRDFLLGGENSYAIDRAWCAEQLRIMPSLRRIYRDERGFLLRAIRAALQEHGIDRFLAIDTGLPSAGSLHKLVLPNDSGRVVYTDHDPVVIAHLSLLADQHPEHLACVPGAFTYPGTILSADDTKLLLAPRSPVGLVLVGVLDRIEDTHELTNALQCYTERLPAGSLVIVTHATVDGLDPADPADRALTEQMHRVCRAYATRHMPSRYLRTAEEVRHILSGLHLVDPGITFTANWHTTPAKGAPRPVESLCLAAVAEVPSVRQPHGEAATSGRLSRCA